MAQQIPAVSFVEGLSFNAFHIIPYYLQGIFTRRRFWAGLFARLHPDPLAVRFGSRLRRKYQSQYVYVYMLANKSLLVMDHDGIKRVLDNSPLIYADSRLKR